MDKMVIVIIDSGVNQIHSLFKNEKIEEYTYIEESHSFKSMERHKTDIFGHGTAIYNIIRECRDFARIINIRINGIEDGIGEETLIGVLQAAFQQFTPQIINLSLGLNICENYKGLYEQCEIITGSGCIILSAFDNTGSIAYPAAFDNVIGVITGTLCTTVYEFEYIEDTVVNIAAKGGIQRVAWSHPEYILISGNSFACAYVTVQAAKYYAAGMRTQDMILQEFKKNALRQYKLELPSRHMSLNFSIQNAAVFPFNKEMHSLIRYQNLLAFDIADVYDSKYSTHIGSFTDHLLKCKNKKNFLIKNINNINWDNFDTLILGHTEELTRLTGKKDFKINLIEQAVSKGKNIYSFDEMAGSDNHKIFCPVITKQHLPPHRFGMLYRISKPVVGVFGTSSRQGKFTLQLKLRELFLKRGYSVGQIGTEPSSLLYGMAYAFPIGYNSSVHIGGFDTVRYLNHIINDLCHKENDIILLGSQSGTVSFDTGNITQYNIPQYDFMVGAQPDICILCVNPFDSIEHIMRTVKFIESSVDCKVLSLVVFPMTINNDWSAATGGKKPLADDAFDSIKEKWQQIFNISVYHLGNAHHHNDIVDEIIDYLS